MQSQKKASKLISFPHSYVLNPKIMSLKPCTCQQNNAALEKGTRVPIPVNFLNGY
jgi:hypothetical protein